MIFDFDGTIGDSFKVAVEIAHSMTHRDLLVMPEEVARLRKLRLLDVAKELHISPWRWPYLVVRGRSLMTKRLPEVQPFPGIKEVLASLQKDGFDLYIMSSNSKRNIDRFMDQYGMTSYFKQFYTGVGLRGKARALRHILQQHQLTAHDVIYIGDEPRDIEASKQVGMPCVAVAWGYNAPEVLQEHTPMVIVESMKQLQSVLENWGSVAA
jgi:phosphoglycolate phosphatase